MEVRNNIIATLKDGTQIYPDYNREIFIGIGFFTHKNRTTNYILKKGGIKEITLDLCPCGDVGQILFSKDLNSVLEKVHLKNGTVGTVNLREVNNVRSIVLENMKVDRSFMVSNLFYYADIQQDNDTMVRLYDIYY